MSVGRFWLNHPNHVDAPHGERPRRRENVEWSRWHMDLICVDLALVTSLDMFTAIRFHRYPIVSCSQDFSGHCMPIRMGSKGSFMYFMDYRVCFMSVDASEQDHIEVSFV